MRKTCEEQEAKTNTKNRQGGDFVDEFGNLDADKNCRNIFCSKVIFIAYKGFLLKYLSAYKY